MNSRLTIIVVLSLLGFSKSPAAKTNEEYLPVKKSTFVNLLDLLVQKGVIEKKDAKGLVAEAEQEARAESKKREAHDRAEADHGSPAQDKDGREHLDTRNPKEKKNINVGYVPEFVQRKIRDEVRAELQSDVIKDARQTAIKEKWALPDMLPSWISRIKPYMDGRMRFSQELYDPNNAPYFNWLAINNEGGISQAIAKDNAFIDTRVDNSRIQERFRLGFDADVTEGLKLGMRLTTTNFYNPVSTNQNLANYQGNWLVALDRAFMQYDLVDEKGNDWLSVWGGRIPNLFMSTEMMWSSMLSMSGIVGTFRYHLNQDDPAVSKYKSPNATGRYGVNLGPQTPDSFYLTAGILPIEDVTFSAHDKYLFAGQAGADWLLDADSRFKISSSFYSFQNIRAIRNSYDSFTYNYTAPEFLQKGNSLGAINDARNQPSCNTGTLGEKNVCLVGLASGFEVFDVMAVYDYTAFAPYHIMFTADFAENFGFDQAYIKQMFGEDITPQTSAYYVRLDVGRPEIRRFGEWNVLFSYRYIERDAVLDAFNDPIFHTGGTDTVGWVLGAQYGLASNTWVDFRWLTANSISGPPLSIDTINLDLNARC